LRSISAFSLIGEISGRLRFPPALHPTDGDLAPKELPPIALTRRER
jgi:hypothetical protein